MIDLYEKLIGVYCIKCKNPNIKDKYIGSSVDIRTRMTQHEQAYNSGNNIKVYEFIRNNGGWNNFTFVLLELTSADDRRTREQYYYDTLGGELNTNRPIASPREIKQVKQIENLFLAEYSVLYQKHQTINSTESKINYIPDSELYLPTEYQVVIYTDFKIVNGKVKVDFTLDIVFTDNRPNDRLYKRIMKEKYPEKTVYEILTFNQDRYLSSLRNNKSKIDTIKQLELTNDIPRPVKLLDDDIDIDHLRIQVKELNFCLKVKYVKNTKRFWNDEFYKYDYETNNRPTQTILYNDIEHLYPLRTKWKPKQDLIETRKVISGNHGKYYVMSGKTKIKVYRNKIYKNWFIKNGTWTKKKRNDLFVFYSTRPIKNYFTDPIDFKLVLMELMNTKPFVLV